MHLIAHQKLKIRSCLGLFPYPPQELMMFPIPQSAERNTHQDLTLSNDRITQYWRSICDFALAHRHRAYIQEKQSHETNRCHVDYYQYVDQSLGLVTPRPDGIQCTDYPLITLINYSPSNLQSSDTIGCVLLCAWGGSTLGRGARAPSPRFTCCSTFKS